MENKRKKPFSSQIITHSCVLVIIKKSIVLLNAECQEWDVRPPVCWREPHFPLMFVLEYFSLFCVPVHVSVGSCQQHRRRGLLEGSHAENSLQSKGHCSSRESAAAQQNKDLQLSSAGFYFCR